MPSLELNYKELHFDYFKNKWDEDSYKSLKNLTKLWDRGHKIIICHPNIVFSKPPVNIVRTDFNKINWLALVDSINIDNRTGYINSTSDFNDTLKYIVKKFRGEIMYSKRSDITMPRHLTVVEIDELGNLMVRGIIKATQRSFYYVTSPMYDLYMPKHSCEIKKRWQSNKPVNLTDFINANTTKNETLL